MKYQTNAIATYLQFLFIGFCIFISSGCRNYGHQTTNQIRNRDSNRLIQWHPYWSNSKFATIPVDAKPSLLIDDYYIPDRFVITRVGTPYEHQIRFPMEFVLVRERAVDLGYGIILPVERPFYICTTELSNWQLALFTSSESGDPGGYLEKRAIEDGTNLSKDLQSIMITYRGDLKKPAVRLKPDEPMSVCRIATGLTNFYFRLPTLSEWFAAMKSDKNTKYWWGNEWDTSVIRKTNTKEFSSVIEFIPELHDVDEGTENPIGLINMFGNAAEIVFPSIQERQILRSYFGPHSQLKIEHEQWKPENLFLVYPYTVFICGGSVFSDAEKTASDIMSLVESRQITLQNIGINRLTTIRLVIDCPPGVIKEIDK